MELVITSEVLQSLEDFRAQRKFEPIEVNHPAFEQPILDYIGAPNETVRVKCEEGINILVDSLISGIRENPNKAFVLDVFREKLEYFRDEETEEIEQATGYCEYIMDILNIESSDGVLNTFIYGVDPMSEQP